MIVGKIDTLEEIIETNNKRYLNLKRPIPSLFEDLFEKCMSANIVIMITSTLRTMEEQAALYAQGRGGYVFRGKTYADLSNKKVTNAPPGRSYHEYGLAFDVAPYVPMSSINSSLPSNLYQLQWEYKYWNRIGEIGESLGLSWGGRWKSRPDRPHFELKGNMSLGTLYNRCVVEGKNLIIKGPPYAFEFTG